MSWVFCSYRVEARALSCSRQILRTVATTTTSTCSQSKDSVLSTSRTHFTCSTSSSFQGSSCWCPKWCLASLLFWPRSSRDSSIFLSFWWHERCIVAMLSKTINKQHIFPNWLVALLEIEIRFITQESVVQKKISNCYLEEKYREKDKRKKIL